MGSTARLSLAGLVLATAAAPWAAFPAGAASAPAGGLVRISATPDGGSPDAASGTYGLAVSSDGSTTVFSSQATNLLPADTDSVPDVYARTSAGLPLTLVSATATGVKGNGMSSSPAVSGDGNEVAFLSAATNLDSADQDARTDVYVKNLVTGDLRLVSTASDGTKANGSATAVTISADGRWVAFVSTATNLDPADSDSAPDLYVKDLVTGALTLASTAADGTKAVAGSYGIGRPSLSADGSVVAYATDAPLDPADTDTTADVYVKNLLTGELTLASTAADGTKGDGASTEPSLSSSGMAVAFTTAADNLDPADGDRMQDVVVKNLTTGEVALASVATDGTKGNGASRAPSLSADGSTVAFVSSSTNLDARDTDTTSDAYVHGPSGTQLASVDGAGDKADQVVVNPGLSADASTLAFATPATNLDPTDTNGWSDVYAKTLTTSATPSPSDSATPSDSASPSDTATPSESASPSDTTTPSESANPSDTTTPSDSASPSDTAIPSDSASPSPSDAPTPSDTPTVSVSPTPTESPTATTPVTIGTVSVGDETIVAPAMSTVPETFTVTLSQPLNVPVTLNYYTADGSAIAGGQYTATNGFLTIDPGATSGKVTVTIVGSNAAVPTTYRLILTSATDGLAVARGTGTGTILPKLDGNPPLLSVGDAVVPTGAGPTSARFTVTLSHPSSSDITAVLVPHDGSATGGVDYTANGVSFTIPSGSVSARVAVQVAAWSGGTDSRQFSVALRLRTGSTHLGRGSGQATLLPPPSAA